MMPMVHPKITGFYICGDGYDCVICKEELAAQIKSGQVKVTIDLMSSAPTPEWKQFIAEAALMAQVNRWKP